MLPRYPRVASAAAHAAAREGDLPHTTVARSTAAVAACALHVQRDNTFIDPVSRDVLGAAIAIHTTRAATDDIRKGVLSSGHAMMHAPGKRSCEAPRLAGSTALKHGGSKKRKRVVGAALPPGTACYRTSARSVAAREGSGAAPNVQYAADRAAGAKQRSAGSPLWCKARSSAYIGVSWNRCSQTWTARANVEKKEHTMGRFADELDAGRAYDAFVIERGLDRRLNFPDDPAAAGHKPARKTKTSKFVGVCWFKVRSKWKATIKVGGKMIYLGLFDDELDAAHARDAYVIEEQLERKLNFRSSAATRKSASDSQTVRSSPLRK